MAIYPICIYMTKLDLLILVMSIPLASLLSINNLHHGFAFLILIYSIFMIFSDIFLLGELFQSSLFSQIYDMISYSSILTYNDSVFALAVPAIIYPNSELYKSQIILDNKGKTGIYMWTHLESSKIYIGSASDLSLRLKGYYSKAYMNKAKSNSYIYNAILQHGYSLFSLTILEYIDISHLSKEDARKLIIEREQYYFNKLLTGNDLTYNILKTAGSSLGYKHSEEVLAKISLPKSEEAKQKLRKPRSEEAKLNMRKPRSEEAKLNMRKPKSEGHKAKISEAHKKLGKVTSPETKALMSAANGTAIFVYDTNSSLVKTFTSATLAAKNYNCSKTTILRYANNGKLFKGQLILSLSVKE